MMNGVRSVVSVVALALVVVGCSQAQESTSTSYTELSNGLKSELDAYFWVADETVPDGGDREHLERHARAITAVTEGLDDWFKKLDDVHASGKLQFPAGITWEDADAYRDAMRVFLADQTERIVGDMACLEAKDDDSSAALPCLTDNWNTHVDRWQADFDVFIATRERAGFSGPLRGGG
jgi:hypothetical protein